MNSAENPETLADIVAGMRDPENDYITNNDLRDLADRIEAAAEREREMSKGLSKKLDKNHDIPGDAAAMREALEKLLAWLDKHGNSYTYIDGTSADEAKAIWQERQEIVAQCLAALAVPARNCDVGTAEEQGDRFAKSCDTYDCCTPCPVKKLWNFKNGHKPSCGVIWGQMLYKAEGGAE